jgi:hypothetical protein
MAAQDRQDSHSQIHDVDIRVREARNVKRIA